jgi:predicted transcriptional regulator
MSKKAELDARAGLISDLSELGIKDKEARVYIALLPHPEAGVSTLVRTTGLHQQFVYNALELLEQKGLAWHTVVRGRRKYTAGAPAKIRTMLEQKRVLADSVIARLATIGAPDRLQDFEVNQGDAAFINQKFNLIENNIDGGYLDIIGGNAETFYNQVLTPEQAAEYERIRLRKKIPLRFIAADGQARFMEDAKNRLPLFDYRLLPQMDVGLVNIVVMPGVVSFDTYATPLLSYTVHSDIVAVSYKAFFDTLWAMCGK